MIDPTRNNDLEVLIVGGGIGGLCLAQGLKKAGVDVHVYERDLTPTSRLQGFRIHIDPDGSGALHECLPGHLWEIFVSTCGDFSQGFTMLNQRLEELIKFRDQPQASDLVAQHRSVSRMTLRQILLSGLGDAVHFGKRFERYEQREDGRIIVFFDDGSRAQCNVLVAADGVNSRVRQQYLPGNDPFDTGVISLGGKIPLTDGVMAMIPPSLLDGPAIVLPAEPANLFLAAWRRSSHASEQVKLLSAANAAGEAAQDEGDYVVLALAAKREFFGFDTEIPESTPGEMRAILRRKMLNWHPNLRKLAEMTGDELGFLRIRSSQPTPPWTPSNVTLLGDAIHSMTPFRGIGANVALRDAALLCSKLVGAQRSGVPAASRIGEYEAEMRIYGFKAVAESLKSMEQAVAPKKLGFKLGMSAMRVAHRVPALRRRIMEQRVTRPKSRLVNQVQP
ncbi:Salicylate hydroxylase [Acidisarcina polymorpha]|uniref:Salicylate hydroxylase n=1 Tax=Acidisarcina polymorpha TaxID=2211140 RepID=A0A2Z5G1A5_9BACT|nr:NAD(P)/FAD-dependent oxidoreductase [Acidisarcina polymorpha]AXC12820.1 Salicylate hydroxylase [Acidisarcina polymorpha]